MDEEARRRFEDLEARLAKSDERMPVTRDLVRFGIRFLRGLQEQAAAQQRQIAAQQQQIAAHNEQIGALIDSDLRIHDRLERISEKLDLLTEKTDRLAEVHRATEQSLKAFIDSLRKSGNGNPPLPAD